MNLGSVWSFIELFVELIIVGALFFTAIGFIAVNEQFKTIAKLAVGGVLVIIFLFAVGAVFSGGAAPVIAPLSFIFFAIGVICLLVVWVLIDRGLDWCGTVFPPIVPFLDLIKLVVSAAVVIVLLLLVADMVLGAGILIRNGGAPFRQHAG